MTHLPPRDGGKQQSSRRFSRVPAQRPNTKLRVPDLFLLLLYFLKVILIIFFSPYAFEEKDVWTHRLMSRHPPLFLCYQNTPRRFGCTSRSQSKNFLKKKKTVVVFFFKSKTALLAVELMTFFFFFFPSAPCLSAVMWEMRTPTSQIFKGRQFVGFFCRSP